MERTREAIDAGRRAQGEDELRCIGCGRLLLRYTPPIGLITMPCRRCGEWSRLSTTESETTRS